MGIQFMTDSTADLSVGYLQEHGVRLIPMTYQIDGREYVDSPFGGENTLTHREFYDAMRMGKQPTTSQINEITYTEAFEQIFAAGDDVFYVSFSSGLTGSLNNARLACEALKERYPERTAYIVDSLSASIGQGLLLMMAVQLHEQGLSPAEIKARLDEERFCVHHWFTVEDLVFLKRGGRISAATAAVGTMLNIKPMLSIDDDGRLVPQEKSKGRKKALKALLGHLTEKAGEAFEGEIYLVHSDADEADIDLLRGMVQAQYDRNVAGIANMTPIIGAHTGPGLMALVFHAPGARR